MKCKYCNKEHHPSYLCTEKLNSGEEKIRMTKREIIEDFMQNVKVEDVTHVRIYGVPMGIGYDFTADVVHKETGEVRTLELHATSKSWDSPDFLREGEPYNTYKGTHKDRPLMWWPDVSVFWKKGYGLKNYLMRMRKQELIDFVKGFTPSQGLNREEIMESIRSLAKSQGSYGRLLENLEELSPEDYEETMQVLERQNFKDPVDMILFFES